jgi:hypothetical protein
MIFADRASNRYSRGATCRFPAAEREISFIFYHDFTKRSHTAGTELL